LRERHTNVLGIFNFVVSNLLWTPIFMGTNSCWKYEKAGSIYFRM
jgi:hypothetical protein